MSRWVRVQTDVFEHALFAREPFTEREAWLWLISKAAWKDTKHRIGQTVVDVPVGSAFLTLREMQAVWRWKSDKRVRSFLSVLEREGMIELKTDAGKTQVTVCNYSRYQDAERTSDASGTQAGRTADALKTPEHQYTTSSLRSEDARTPRDALETVLDAERAQAVLDHRQRLRKPLTAHAAKLLAEKLAQVSDPNAAADEMIANGWQGFKPEWLESRTNRATAPPQNDMDRMNAALDSLISGKTHEPDEQYGRTIDASFERRDRGGDEGSVQRLAVPARN